MDFGFVKKGVYAILIVCAATWYVSTHYTFEQVLDYQKKHPHADYSPPIVYYSGMAFFIRDQHEGAINAFQQLLADYPTCQYAPKAMVRLGTSLMERNRYAEAREVFDRYFEQFPEDRDRKTVEAKYEYIKFK